MKKSCKRRTRRTTHAILPPMTGPTPEWFTTSEAATAEVMQRIAESVRDLPMVNQVRSAPMLAHWFLLDTLLLANQANQKGMHANALALTRQCVESMGVIELGICGHAEAEAILMAWDADRLTSGKLRAWLETNVWPSYGSGLWTEPWSTFMREFASAVRNRSKFPGKRRWIYAGAWRMRLARCGMLGPGMPRRSPMNS